MTAGHSVSDRLTGVFDRQGRLCVGIDPHSYLLDAWSLPDSANGAREFGLRVVDAAADLVGVVKPQIAFFERFGSAGFAALEAVLAAAREAGLFVIADVKRGDVGSTVDAYAAAWLSPGAPLEADAMTVSPFQGVGALSGVLAMAGRYDKAVFVLCATSNPESGQVQLATDANGQTVAAGIAGDVLAYNASDDRGTAGLVLGATVDLSDYGIDRGRRPDGFTPILAPGFGHQGAHVADARRLYGELAPGLIVTESRSLLAAGPQGIAAAIRSRVHEVHDVFH